MKKNVLIKINIQRFRSEFDGVSHNRLKELDETERVINIKIEQSDEWNSLMKKETETKRPDRTGV